MLVLRFVATFPQTLPTVDQIAQFMCLLILVVNTNGYCYKIFALVLIALMSLFVYVKPLKITPVAFKRWN